MSYICYSRSSTFVLTPGMDFISTLQHLGEHPAEPVSPMQALKTLNETVTEAFLACIRGQPEITSQHLILALPQLLQAMAVLNIDPVQALRHQSQPHPDHHRLIYVEGNRVEVRVNDELRGSWSIWSIADLKEVCRLAEEFDCGLVYSLKGFGEGRESLSASELMKISQLLSTIPDQPPQHSG
ncbi:MAG: hypothetical protein OHK0012_17410 [Synechococcales cyanobacterium]